MPVLTTAQINENIILCEFNGIDHLLNQLITGFTINLERNNTLLMNTGEKF